MTFLRHHLGLDLSDRAARFARLRPHGRPRVLATGDVAVDLPASQARGEDPARVGRALRAALRTSVGAVHEPFVAAAVPDAACFVFSMPVPQQPTHALAEAIRWEAAQHLPYEHDNVVVDWRLVAAVSRPAASGRVVVTAMERDRAEWYAAVCEGAGLTSVLLAPASLATVQACVFPEQGAAVIVRIGARDTALTLMRDGCTLATVVTDEYAADLVTQTLCDHLHLTREESLKAQRVWGVDPSFPDQSIRTALARPLERLIRKIQELLEYAAETEGTNSVSHVFLTGPGNTLFKLADALTAATHLQPLPPPRRRWRSVAADDSFDRYGAAIGVALAPLP